MDSACFFSDETWLEKYSRATETFTGNSNNISIRKFISFFLVGTFGGSFHFTVKVQCNVAQLFFHITHNLTLSGCGERITTFRKDFHQLLCEIPACKVKSKNGMW